MEAPFVNKVAESGIITIDLSTYLPAESNMVTFDLKDYLFMGLILKEKDFRESLSTLDTASYAGKWVTVTCTADAIIPMWAYMLVASCLQPVAAGVWVGNPAEAATHWQLHAIRQIDTTAFAEKRVVIKGCGDQPVAAAAYAEMTRILHPVVRSLMYGEPCSTVPIYKRKAAAVPSSPAAD